jgi:hypothetical protein
MGIGSCLNLKDQNTEILKREEEIVAMQQLYSNKLVICRDSFASSILENAQITHHCLPCPAYYCYNTESNHNKNTNVLVWTDPTQTISRENWKDKEKLQKFYDINLSYIKQYKPDIYCAFESDVPQAEMLGFKPKTLKDWKETLTIMTNAKKVLSSRIHCCVPAFVQEAEVGIIPLDTRHYVLSDYGCPLIENNEQINNIKVCKLNYSKYLEKYNKIITKYIE